MVEAEPQSEARPWNYHPIEASRSVANQHSKLPSRTVFGESGADWFAALQLFRKMNASHGLVSLGLAFDHGYSWNGTLCLKTQTGKRALFKCLFYNELRLINLTPMGESSR